MVYDLSLLALLCLPSRLDEGMVKVSITGGGHKPKH